MVSEIDIDLHNLVVWINQFFIGLLNWNTVTNWASLQMDYIAFLEYRDCRFVVWLRASNLASQHFFNQPSTNSVPSPSLAG